MGNSQSGKAGALGQCAPGRGQRTADGNLVLAIVRSRMWGLGDTEDVWLVEIGATATVGELKSKIEALYDVAYASQTLSLRAKEYLAWQFPLEDATPVETVAKQKIYLFPSPEAWGRLQATVGGSGTRYKPPTRLMPFSGSGSRRQEAILQTHQAALRTQEQFEINAALEASLSGVTYEVHFHRPESAGGAAAGRRVQLAVEPLDIVDDVQQLVELELFGAVGVEPAFLHFQGAALSPTITLFQAGVEDGAIVQVSTEPPPVFGVTISQDVMAGIHGYPQQGAPIVVQGFAQPSG